jgi:pimeloyl-ACP methyl ester carboxylesterase
MGAFVRDLRMNPLLKAGAWFMMNNPWAARTWVMYYRTLYPSRKPPDFGEYLRGLRENLADPKRFQAAKALADSSRIPSAERLPRVKAPVLVLMGSKDPDFADPGAEGRFIADQTRGRLELIAGAGHYPQTEMPEVTTPIVLEFLRGVS